MKVRVEKISPEAWQPYAEAAAEAVFGVRRPGDLGRFDFALLLVNDAEDIPVAYVTCKELDDDTLYWQFGGPLPSLQGIHIFRVFAELVGWTLSRYERATMFIENENVPALRMAMAAGFRISGVRFYAGEILCELFLERKES